MDKDKRYMKYTITIIISIILYSTVCVSNDNDRISRAEGVQYLKVYLNKDYDNFNYTCAVNNLTNDGYSPDGLKNEDGWYIRVQWQISDKDYASNYISYLTVTIYGFLPNDSGEIRSSILVGFETPILNEDINKKIRDKELSKQAAYEIASVINVKINWDSYIYGINWMTMTSEGSYEEK